MHHKMAVSVERFHERDFPNTSLDLENGGAPGARAPDAKERGEDKDHLYAGTCKYHAGMDTVCHKEVFT